MSKPSSYSRKFAPDSPERKLSVFDRLGTKALSSGVRGVCESWAQHGTCPLNKTCKYVHTHVLISPSKRSKTEVMKKHSAALNKKSKEEHKKGVKGHQSAEVDWDQWELENLEGADEKALERRRQELQRELQLQLKKEKELTKKKEKPDKKRTRSTSSSSSSSSDSSSSTSSSSSSSSAPRKHQNRKRKRGASSSESDVSPQRQKKSPKLCKVKTGGGTAKKSIIKKDTKVESMRSKAETSGKKTVVHKESASPGWDRQGSRTATKQVTKKPSPHNSSDGKRDSSSPRYYTKERNSSKTRPASPKRKSKEFTPKRVVKKREERNHSKERSAKQTTSKPRLSPVRAHKSSPPRCRKQEDVTDKKRGHDDRKHSPRRERSREKDRKREVRRRTPESELGGLKKGGKILPLKRTSYGRETGVKSKDQSSKSDKTSEGRGKDDEGDRDKGRFDRDKDKEKEKGRSDRDKEKDRKDDDHDRKRERDARNREVDRRETERVKLAKEREAERQRERDEALERCRERQREREKLQKEKKDKEEKKHHRDHGDAKKEYERELPALLDIKTDHGSRHDSKKSDYSSRERRNEKSDKPDIKPSTPDKDQDRRDARRSHDSDRKQGDARRGRDPHPSYQVVRRTLTEERRPWDDRRRGIEDRRPLVMLPRTDDFEFRRAREEADDLRLEERRRKLGHGFHHDGPRDGGWEVKEGDLDFREAERREDWDRHHDWAPRYERKWVEHDREGEEPGWNRYNRRPQGDDWNNDWAGDGPAPARAFPATEDGHRPDDQADKNIADAKRHVVDTEGSAERPASAAPMLPVAAQPPWDGEAQRDEVTGGPGVGVPPSDGLGEALSDISDDADDILNQDDDMGEDVGGGNTNPVAATGPTQHQPATEFFFDQRRPLLECLGERALDFEEISDEELEEEARLTRGIMDVLGADWAGLVQQTRPRPKRPEGPGSSHRRWKLDKIVERLGISYKLAGKEFADTLLAKCRNIALAEETPAAKVEDPVVVKPEVKSEPMDVDVATPTATVVTLLAPDPAVHTTLMEARSCRTFLFANHNRFKRALSARTDLAIRRELCNLPAKEPLIFPPPLDTAALFQVSLGLFQRCP